MKPIPSVLYLIPTENHDEDVELDSISIYGWEKPPQPGTTLLVVPSDRDQLTRNLRWLYTVKSSSETGDREWPFELELEARPVSQPRTWYEIVREAQFRGLAPLSGDLDEDWSGSKLVHPATISMIFEMVGEA